MARKRAAMVMTAVLVCCAQAAAAQENAVKVLGQVVAQSVEMDGITVPSGATVLSPSQLKTTLYPAFVHLEIGVEVEMATDSGASFEAVDDHQVRLTVHSGSVSLRGDNGSVVTALAGSVILLSKAEDDRIAALPPAGGLRTATKIGIGIGIGAAGIAGVGIYVLDDDEEKPASRILPR